MASIPCEENGVIDASKCTKFISLDDDCLEFLFGYLGWTDLLSVADSSPLFHTAACLVFKRKYHKSKLIINGTKSSSSQKCGNIIVQKPLMALKLLRNFGHLIWDLQLSLRFFRSEIVAAITHYLSQYCSKSLYSLSLCGNSTKIPFECIENVFINLEILRVDLCKFELDLMFGKIFPNLRVLNLGANRYESPQTMIDNLPSLSHLTMQVNKFEENDIEAMIKRNPQLERLEIFPVYSLQLIKSINECLPNLRSLELKCLPQEFYNRSVKPIQLDHIVNLALHVGNTPFQNIPFSFKRLENLLVIGANEPPLRLGRKCLDFFQRLQHLKQLTILGWYSNERNIRKFFELPTIMNVEELSFNWIDHIPNDCILQFLKKNQRLRIMKIYGNETANQMMDAINKRLNGGWQMKEGLFNRECIIERNDSKQ